MLENRRRAVAESLSELGETDAAESLFEQWLAVNPRWGWGWIGWADLHYFTNRRPQHYGRAEELLRRGYSTPSVRDKEDIAARLAHLYEETGRGTQALEFADDARRVSAAKSGISVRRTVDLVQAGDRAAVRDSATITFGGEGLPLDRLEEIVTALDASRRPARTTKVGRNAPVLAGADASSRSAAAQARRLTAELTAEATTRIPILILAERQIQSAHRPRRSVRRALPSPAALSP